MNVRIPTTSSENCIDLAISELILVASREELVLSDAFERVDDKWTTLASPIRSELVAATLATNSHQYIAAIEAYDRAIAIATACRAIEVEALACELAARFYLDWGKPKFATIYLQTARDCYARWGSRAKSTALETDYPQLFPIATPSGQQPLGAVYFTDEFIATLSYEFRTPLDSILGIAEVLLEEVYGKLNDRQLNAIATIDRSSGYLLALMNNTLDLCKIQVGTLELALTDVSIVELCHASLSVVKPHAIQRQIQLEVDLQAVVGTIAVDRDRICQALIDLLNRAISATPAGGSVILRVSEDPVPSDDRSWLKFAIVDTSKQIPKPPELPEEIAARSSDRRQLEGYNAIGFGLMLVKPIVELHGGFLDDRSEIGRGNCTSISLPHHSSDLTTATQIDSLTDLAALTAPLTRETIESPLILIAEDNELNIETTASYLNAKGYRTIWANNGIEAIALTKSERPDLILMDIQMPQLDGIAAIAQIRADPHCHDLPIVALTALAMAGDRERCLAAGANEYMSKPISLKQLVVTIKQLLAPDLKMS